MNGPLHGITVADFSELLPGPFMTGAMAEMGADVIKVERPGGDGMRQSSPGTFEIINRGKASVALDLKNDANLAKAIEIVKQADVMVEGFRPGVMQKLGLGYDAMAALNPGLVYISMSGYGQAGPMVKAPGHDLNYLALVGITSLCGQPDGAPEHTFGLPVADLGGALYGLAAVNAALLQRANSGKGQHLDLSIADCLAHWVNPRRGVYNARDIHDIAEQRQIALVRPAYGVFPCTDGAISIAALEGHFWKNLCNAVDLGEFDDAKFATLNARRAVSSEINAAIAQAIAPLSRDAAMAQMEAHDVPASPVLSVDEATTSAHFEARGLITETRCGPATPFPIQLNGMRRDMPAAPDLNSLKA
jgi:CoA:oxalate CoA-transferase